MKAWRDWYYQVLCRANHARTIDDLGGSATLPLEEGIVGQCIVSHDDDGGRSRKGWVGLADGGIKKIGWIVMNDR